VAIVSCRAHLTGWSDDESRRGEGAGFADHLIKPVDFDGLHHVLARAGAWSAPQP
jgi:hypothetical protein